MGQSTENETKKPFFDFAVLVLLQVFSHYESIYIGTDRKGAWRLSFPNPRKFKKKKIMRTKAFLA